MIGLVASIMFVIQLISDLGFRSYLLRHATDPSLPLIRNLWSIQLLRGVCLTLVGFALAEPAAAYVEIEGFDNAVRIACLLFLITGFTSLAPFLSEKEGHVIKPVILDFIAGTLGLFLTLLLTLAYKSVWCVIVGGLLFPIFSLIFSYVFYSKSYTGFSLDMELSKDFLAWSKYILPSSIITILYTQLDKFTLVKILSSEQLGAYFIALNISMLGTRFLIDFSQTIVGSALASQRSATTAQLTDMFYKTKHGILLLASLGLGIGISAANSLVGVVYEANYASVGPFLALLLLRAVLCIWTYPFETFLITKGHAKYTLVGNVLRVVWILLGVFPAYELFGYWGVIFIFVTVELPVALFYITKMMRYGSLKFGNELSYLLACIGAYYVVKLLGFT